MIFRTIPFDSPGYRDLLALRHEVLRAPLGLSVYDEDLEAEREQQAYGLFDDNGELVAGLLIVPLAGKAVKLRQMVVRLHCQKQNLGRALVQQVEAQLRRTGIETIELHARSAAVGFYRRLGYESEGPEFQEVGIPHQKLRKTLSPEVRPSPSAAGSA